MRINHRTKQKVSIRQRKIFSPCLGNFKNVK